MCGIYLKYLQDPSNPKEAIEAIKRLDSIKHRGPDDFRYVIHNNWFLGFTRLAIVDVSERANQPLTNPFFPVTNYIICNGEIYNHSILRKDISIKSFSNSDCEIILHLLLEQDISTVCNTLDGVFALACIIEDKLYIARDPIGIRPLFYGIDQFGYITLASEAKALIGSCDQVRAFPPGCYTCLPLDTPHHTMEIHNYVPSTLYNPAIIYTETEQHCIEALTQIRTTLIEAVMKRTMTDRPIGLYLSGGLDSSLIAAILAKHAKLSFTAFTIGMKGGEGPDMKAAECVAEYLGIPLVKVYFTSEEGCALIEDIIYQLETYDTTTIRASIPNYLVSKYVQRREIEKVILMGEGPDEVAQGYQYFKQAPDSEKGYLESVRLVKNLYKTDVLRTDRTTSAHGLEVRVPFLDKRFIETVYSMPRKWVCASEGNTKNLIRSAFDPKIAGCEKYLPDKILWRQKEAFSDSVGYDWRKSLGERADKLVTDETMTNATRLYPQNTPKSKEAMLYRQIYDRWYKHIDNVDKYWMPEESWFDTKLTDPSALVLNCYNNSNEDQ
ncbi:Asparagine synthase B [Oopsacas minuta]|uniref:Asparagine synthetase [glutamine-hydrolyzing] n=1 Tax=Oopsacas minuta TaxID=111878 RepID=A0AAV7K7L1_9METZ|nr:Asparagine synthase B [Oopsacas minuta]